MIEHKHPNNPPSPHIGSETCILSESSLLIQKYAGKTVVIKYGGHAMGNHTVMKEFARDIVFLRQSGLYPIIIHGGGPQVDAMLGRLGIKSRFHGGLRITNEGMVSIVEMVLSGGINKQIVGAINSAGGQAVGISGKDGRMVIAHKIGNDKKKKKQMDGEAIDLGFVGRPNKVDPSLLSKIMESGFIPVISPVASSETDETYNINADTFAGAIAGASRADRLLLLTNTPGVLDKKNMPIERLSREQAKRFIIDGTIKEGMIPKIEACLHAVGHGVRDSVIFDGRVPHAVLRGLHTRKKDGTLID